MLTFKLAFRNLFRNTRRTVLTCTLLGFGLTALIFTDGIVNGMSKLMIDSVTSTLQGEMQVHHIDFPGSFNTDNYMDDVDSIVKTIESHEQVTGYAVRALSGGMISSSYNMTGAIVYGIEPDRELAISKISSAIVSGKYLTDKPNEILLGSELVEQIEASLGDRIVVTIAEVETGEISQALFRLTGVFHFGLSELDESFAFIHLDRARELLGLGSGAHEIAIRFENPEISKDPNLALRAELSKPDRIVRNWMEFNPEIGSVVEMSNYSTAIVGGILFLLVSLGVINSMFMSIYERMYEFGVVKAIGTSPLEIMTLVFWEAIILGIMSAILGLVITIPIAWWTSINGIPFGEAEVSGVAINGNILPIFNSLQFLVFPLYITLLTLVAAIYPAIYAAKIVPSDALQRSL